MDEDGWGHSIHYHRVVLDALPDGASRVLDVGCGDGLLARRLRRHVAEVVALDVDEPILDVARAHADADADAADIDFVHGDILVHPFERASFDAVVSVAALHHVDAAAASNGWPSWCGPAARS